MGPLGYCPIETQPDVFCLMRCLKNNIKKHRYTINRMAYLELIKLYEKTWANFESNYQSDLDDTLGRLITLLTYLNSK
ncbi:hypothetical protein GpSGHVEth168 [Glossina pallidipes salivary gland hypertrophy virus]|uniref:Uncharacterized protein n=2 Tax=Glossina hytrovirus (isolate Glossina pallidipes/Ethiopia/Seibersdorf/-) TaxID=379529 RepID=A0A0Y0K7K7_GHVS|nr:hypothetical protein SGHV153 [Glossina pallidipes salivary gland hypertrophy virus]ABQ08926.1 hypothetical protein SGHV153 [Glossina pallidipes salivary gland hypertrophy virus]AMB48772.1 hypothetical protein GpSGHVEth168 [Glossina pallidipes salivary gland hypertrophy virus]